MADKLPEVHIALTDNPGLLALRFAYSKIVDAIVRAIPGATWVKTAKCWAIPNSSLPEALRVLMGIPHRIDADVPVPPPETPDWLRTVRDETLSKSIDEKFTFATPSFKHQRICMELGIKAKQFALFMEMGTGKTKATIDIINWWLQIGDIGAALIVAPKAVLWAWEREIHRHSHFKRMVSVLTGSGADKREAFEKSKDMARWFVTNYATLRDEELDFGPLIHRKRMAIVLDESSNIANHNSKQSKGAYRLGKLTNFKLILNGTPIANGPLDAFGQFMFLDPNILGHLNFTSFKSEYTISGGFKNKGTIGYKNLDRLQARIAKNSFRVVKKDCLDLPDKLYRVVELDIGSKMRDVYRQLRDEAIVELEGKVEAVPLVVTRMMRLQQITSGYLPTHDEFGEKDGTIEVETVKLDAMEELVNEAVAQNRKVIVWSRFRPDVERAALRLAAHGAVAYHGGVSEVDRQSAVDRFQNDPEVKVFVGQSHTGGIGITLTAATVEIYLANSFSYLDRAQSEDRAHRIGQKNNVDIIDLVVRGTIDEYVLRCLQQKKDVAFVVTGDALKEALGNA